LLNTSRLTPNGQITIPRTILKRFGIAGGGAVTIELEDNRLVLKKVDEKREEYSTAGCVRS